MSDEIKIRVALAELCGWKGCTDMNCCWRKCQHLHKDGVVGFPEPYSTSRYPDYPADLNAINQARQQLITSVPLRVKYLNALRSIIGKRMPKNKAGAAIISDYDLLDASAKEFSEALLKALEVEV